MDHMKSWWILNELGKDYEIFSPMMIRPPIPPYSEVVTLSELYVERHQLDLSPCSSTGFLQAMHDKSIPPYP